MAARLNRISVEFIGIVLLAIAILIAITGYLHEYNDLELGMLFGNIIKDFYANASSELISIAITVLIIDRLNRRREANEAELVEIRKQQLQAQKEATAELRMVNQERKAEAERRKAEAERKKAEQTRLNDVKLMKRADLENERKEAKAERKAAADERKKSDAERTAAVDERKKSESERKAAETWRNKHK